ncbi:MAG TPA: hypothetical protein DCY20_01505 [Firmicutes bacterium]|nr:hypothetical protein [Bacillota bacterium]
MIEGITNPITTPKIEKQQIIHAETITPVQPVQNIQELSEADTQKIVEQVNEKLEAAQSLRLSYQQHEKTGKYYITLVDAQTDEVVREIPAKQLLDYAAGIDELLGLSIDKRA